jgi:N-acetylmuramoyl-L-alanine amidase
MTFYKIYLILFSFLLLHTNGFSFTVLIDPGHGGDDHGAKATLNKELILEKDIALNISKEVYRILKSKFHVFLSRSFDRTLTLSERSEVAEKVKADIFISIHVNSSPKKEGHGFETFYLDNHDDVAVKKVEDTENKNLSGEALVINQILTDLVIQNTVESSKKLANLVHQELKTDVGKKFDLKDRGIKPGLFYVLALAKRPSLLLEVGFISNQKELEKIKSIEFQKEYAKAVAEGIIKYHQSLKSGAIKRP